MIIINKSTNDAKYSRIVNNNLQLQMNKYTENEILVMLDEVDMKILLTTQKLSKKFILEHIIPNIKVDDEIDLEDIVRWQHLL